MWQRNKNHPNPVCVCMCVRLCAEYESTQTYQKRTARQRRWRRILNDQQSGRITSVTSTSRLGHWVGYSGPTGRSHIRKNVRTNGHASQRKRAHVPRPTDRITAPASCLGLLGRPTACVSVCVFTHAGRDGRPTDRVCLYAAPMCVPNVAQKIYYGWTLLCTHTTDHWGGGVGHTVNFGDVLFGQIK